MCIIKFSTQQRNGIYDMTNNLKIIIFVRGGNLLFVECLVLQICVLSCILFIQKSSSIFHTKQSCDRLKCNTSAVREKTITTTTTTTTTTPTTTTTQLGQVFQSVTSFEV